MNPSRADDAPSDAVGSLSLLGETLACAASLEQMGQLVVRRVCEALGARRVALLARHETPRLTAVADTAPGLGAAGGDTGAIALPLGGGTVDAILVVQDPPSNARPALEAFRARVTPAVAAARAGAGDTAAARARIAGQVVHKINNRLGAIHIYAYLLAERLKKGTDASSIEVATKLCAAVDRLGAEVAGLATPAETAGALERTAGRVDALVEACLASFVPLPGTLRVVRELDDVGAASVHEPTMRDALGVLLRAFAADGTLVVRTRRPSPHTVEIVLEGAGGPALVPAALFAGDAGDDTARALACDLVERHGAVVAMTRAAGGHTMLRVALDAAME